MVAALLLGVSALWADTYFNDWVLNPGVKVADPTGDTTNDPGGLGAKDITAVWWARDASFDYFRMDVANPLNYSTDFATEYGIFLDSAPGGPPSKTYLPVGYDDAENIIDAHVDSSGWTAAHKHDWPTGIDLPAFGDYDLHKVHVENLIDGSVFGLFHTVDGTLGPTFNPSQPGATTVGSLEWEIPLGELPTDFCFRGATANPGELDPGGSGFERTYDETAGSCDTPELGSFALLGMSMLPMAGVAVRRRRRKSA